MNLRFLHGHGDEVVGAGGLGDLADGDVRPFGVATEPEMMTILFAWGAVRTPPTWRATVDEIWSAVYLGVCPR